MYQPRTGNPRRKNHLVQSVFFILLVMVSVYILLQSPLFEIKKIIVNGNRQLNSEEITKFTAITPGINIFKLNVGEAEARLKMVPLLKSSEVKRKLPHTIVINVVERKAVALLAVKNSFIKVDADGVYLQKGQMASALPVITGLDSEVSGPGKHVKARYLPEALESLGKMPRTLVQKLSELNMNEAGQLTLYTEDGIQGRMGWSKEVEYKSLIFQQVIDNLKAVGGEIQYIDLSNPKVPVVKYFKNPQEGQL